MIIKLVELKKWQPKNYGGNFEGIVTFRDSLTESRNLATLNLVNDLGVTTVTNELKILVLKMLKIIFQLLWVLWVSL